MRRSTVLFVVISIIIAGVCTRLGFWQLSRLEQRRARNATIAARMAAAPIPLDRLPGDTSATRFRRVTVVGRLDVAHEFMLTLRGHNGSPGVDIITPLRIEGADSAVLVNRGWVYSPDGMTADLARWREQDSVFQGYIEQFDPGVASDSLRRNGIRRMSYEAVARAMPYPVRKLYVVATSDSGAARSANGVIRLQPPALDEGSHMSYAFQWFSFATIALIGGGLVAARTMRT